jgi:hypothetical protein
MSHGRSAEVARKECEHNIDGYHVRNYQPGRIAALSSFLGELTDLPILVLEGCACWPRLRICHGCHDVFKYNVAPQIFPQLTEFGVTNMFIRGGPLRTFISRHSSALKSVGIDQVFLTDGSWKSVADGLSRHCSLESILILVYQRSPAQPCRGRRRAELPRKQASFVRRSMAVRRWIDFWPSSRGTSAPRNTNDQDHHPVGLDLSITGSSCSSWESEGGKKDTI